MQAMWLFLAREAHSQVFLLSTAINVTLLFPGNKKKKSATTEKTAQVSIAQRSCSSEHCALLIKFSSAIKQTTEG